MVVVPSSSDVLKQSSLQSFKTRRHNFATDGKNSEPPRTAVVPNRNDVLKQSSLQSFKTRRFSFCHGRQKLRTATDGSGSTQQRCFKAKLFAKL
ncbi:hypothetical protein DWQ65_06650 [Treponema phagedenis]|nr:hypothetical protein DWQ65_00200 [Treponema phagedenis]QSH99745.1 hypothetical protein DWQ65_06650 [Treponema phagedenis]